MANNQDIAVDAQTPERVLSVIDLEHESSECMLHIAVHQRTEPSHCGFQHHSVIPEIHQSPGTILLGEMNVSLFHTEKVDAKLSEPCEITKNGALRALGQMAKTSSQKGNNICPSTLVTYSLNDRHPLVRRSCKNIRLNDPHAFDSTQAEVQTVIKMKSLLNPHDCADSVYGKHSITSMNVSVYAATIHDMEKHECKDYEVKGLSQEFTCEDSMGEPLTHSRQQHFVSTSTAEFAANLRCEQIEFKKSFGDQVVDDLPQESSKLSAQCLARLAVETTKERSLDVLQEISRSEKGIEEKDHRKKGCFQQLFGLCFATKSKQKTVNTYYTPPHEGVHPILQTPATEITGIDEEISPSGNHEKYTPRDGHHILTGWFDNRQKTHHTVLGKLRLKRSTQEMGKHIS